MNLIPPPPLGRIKIYSIHVLNLWSLCYRVTSVTKDYLICRYLILISLKDLMPLSIIHCQIPTHGMEFSILRKLNHLFRTSE